MGWSSSSHTRKSAEKRVLSSEVGRVVAVVVVVEVVMEVVAGWLWWLVIV